jgi:hypothetical protein
MLECVQYLESIHMRHHDIEDDNSWLEFTGFCDTSESIIGIIYGISLRSEAQHIHFSDIVVILDDKDRELRDISTRFRIIDLLYLEDELFILQCGGKYMY